MEKIKTRIYDTAKSLKNGVAYLFKPITCQYCNENYYDKYWELTDDRKYFQELSPSDLKIQEISRNIGSSCFNCNATFKSIKLQCKHWICYTCISKMLFSLKFENNIKILKCKCNKVIKSKIFEEIVFKETLFEYLDRLNSYKLKHFSNVECPVCGHDHTKDVKCSDFFKDSQSIQFCSCGQPEQHLLPCDHPYCYQCTMQLAIETWAEDTSSHVVCKLCKPIKTTVPLFILEKSFGGSNNYQKKKKEFTGCKICLKTFSTKLLITLGCEHRFCIICIKTYIEDEINIMEDKITCPDCHIKIDEDLMQTIIDSELYQNYMQKSFKGFNFLGNKNNEEEKNEIGYRNCDLSLWFSKKKYA